MEGYSPSPYDQPYEQAYSSPVGSPYNPAAGLSQPKTSNKPTGKGSRGPYKPRANKASQQVAGSSVSPQRPPPKPKAPKKKRKEKSPSLGEDDDIDLDDLEETPQRMLSKDDDDEDGVNGRSGSRAGSRAGTPMGGQSGARHGSQAPRDGTAGPQDQAPEEEEEPEVEDDEEKAAAATEARIVKERTDEVKTAQMLLVGHLDAQQQQRFDAWKTSTFAKAQVRRLITSTTGNSISEDLAQIVGGVSKVYVGLIVRKAREVQLAHHHTGPLTPFHLREAHRLYVRESRSTKRPGSGLTKKALFIR